MLSNLESKGGLLNNAGAESVFNEEKLKYYLSIIYF